MITFGWHFLWIDEQLLSWMMDDWNLDEKPLGKWQTLQQCKSIISQQIYNE